MNAKTEIPRAPLQADLIETVDRYNSIFELDPHATMMNVSSVLAVVKQFMQDNEEPGVRHDKSVGIELILQCCIDAIDGQSELKFQQQRAKEGGAVRAMEHPTGEAEAAGGAA